MKRLAASIPNSLLPGGEKPEVREGRLTGEELGVDFAEPLWTLKKPRSLAG